MRYDLTDNIVIEMHNRFTYHEPKEDQPERYEYLRDMGFDLALALHQYCPESRERSIALGKLEEAIMWANASIARRE